MMNSQPNRNYQTYVLDSRMVTNNLYKSLGDPPQVLTTTGGNWLGKEVLVGDLVQIPGEGLAGLGQLGQWGDPAPLPNNLPLQQPEVSLEKLVEMYDLMRKVGVPPMGVIPEIDPELMRLLAQAKDKRDAVPAAIIEREDAVSEERPRRKFRF